METGLLSVYYWNSTELQPIINYTAQFTIIPKATILNNDLYLAWLGLNNTSNGQCSIYIYNNITISRKSI